jgi:hypothetical protein
MHGFITQQVNIYRYFRNYMNVPPVEAKSGSKSWWRVPIFNYDLIRISICLTRHIITTSMHVHANPNLPCEQCSLSRTDPKPERGTTESFDLTAYDWKARQFPSETKKLFPLSLIQNLGYLSPLGIWRTPSNADTRRTRTHSRSLISQPSSCQEEMEKD